MVARKLIVLALLLPSLLMAGPNPYLRVVAKKKGAGGGGGTGGDLLTENFETPVVGYENVWSPQGSVNPVYTTTVLQGTQSCFFDANSDNAILDIAFTSQTTVYVYFKWRTAVAIPPFTQIIRISDASETECCRLLVDDSGTVTVDSNGVFSSSSVTTLSPNTTYHFWISYVKGTGANAVVTGAFSTSGVRPTSGNAFVSLTNGAGTVNAELLRLRNEPNAGWNSIYDRVLVNTTQIGDNP